MLHAHAKRPSISPACMETVECRRLLSTVIVDTLADESVANSTTSLREAIQLAAAGDTVQFRSGLTGTITLGGQELFIKKNLTIAGPGSAKLVVSGNNASRVFSTDAGVTATLSGIAITGGHAEVGAGVYNGGASLTLSKVKVSGNVAHGADGKYADGGDARGGGVYNWRTLVVIDSEISGNSAVGGSGQLGLTIGNAGNASGGGIYNDVGGNVTLTNTKLSNNTAVGGTPAGGAGNAGGGNGGYARGGAVFNLAGLNFFNCTIANNSATGSSGGNGDLASGAGGEALGGAVYSASTLSVASSVFSANFAKGGEGGLIASRGLFNSGGQAVGGALHAADSLTVADSTFNGNYAIAGNRTGATGGAIASFGFTWVVTSTIAGNSAKGDQNPADNDAEAGATSRGGGIYVGGAGPGGMIDRCTLSDNAVLGGAGGSGYHSHGNDYVSAPGGQALGGGAYVDAIISVHNSTVANNTATGGKGGDAHYVTQSPGAAGGDAAGAGVYVATGAEGPITSSTVAGNTATGGKGGAPGLDNPGGPDLPAGANGRALAGGVFAGGSTQFANSIIAGNKALAEPDVAGAIVTSGFNLIGNVGTTISAWIFSDLVGTAASPLNPKLGPLAANGGPTKTMAPLPGSPTLDKGKAFGAAFEQRGLKRTVNLPAVADTGTGDATDIGAVEIQSTPFGGAPVQIASDGSTTVDAERFDLGDDGVAYHDSTTANLGGAFRTGGVDLQAVQNDSGGYNVGWTKAGEWLNYTVDVPKAGPYNLDVRVASNGAGGKFHLELDGKDVTGPLSVPNTSGWQAWKTISKAGVNLPSGVHVLRLVMDSVGPTGSVGNFNYLKFSAAAVSQKLTLKAAEAAHVRDGSYRWSTYGTSPALEVKKSTTNYSREAYLKFDLGSVSTVASAKLRIYGNVQDALASVGLAVHAVSDTTWSELALTWSNKPAVDANPLATTTIAGTAAKWYEIDLTPHVKAAAAKPGPKSLTLVLKGTTVTSALCQFSSDEAAASNAPQLVVTT